MSEVEKQDPTVGVFLGKDFKSAKLSVHPRSYRLSCKSVVDASMLRSDRGGKKSDQ